MSLLGAAHKLHNTKREERGFTLPGVKDLGKEVLQREGRGSYIDGSRSVPMFI